MMQHPAGTLAARGIVNGLLLSIPVWVLILLTVALVVRWIRHDDVPLILGIGALVGGVLGTLLGIAGAGVWLAYSLRLFRQ